MILKYSYFRLVLFSERRKSHLRNRKLTDNSGDSTPDSAATLFVAHATPRTSNDGVIWISEFLQRHLHIFAYICIHLHIFASYITSWKNSNRPDCIWTDVITKCRTKAGQCCRGNREFLYRRHRPAKAGPSVYSVMDFIFSLLFAKDRVSRIATAEQFRCVTRQWGSLVTIYFETVSLYSNRVVTQGSLLVCPIVGLYLDQCLIIQDRLCLIILISNWSSWSVFDHLN